MIFEDKLVGLYTLACGTLMFACLVFMAIFYIDSKENQKAYKDLQMSTIGTIMRCQELETISIMLWQENLELKSRRTTIFDDDVTHLHVRNNNER